MNKKLIKLFSKLDTYWNLSGSEYKGENPACYDIQKEILEELKSLTSNEVSKVLIKLTDEQLNQIISITEEIIEHFPDTAKTFIKINDTRNIECLDNELKLIGIKL